jgi:hypothetical protein
MRWREIMERDPEGTKPKRRGEQDTGFKGRSSQAGVKIPSGKRTNR